MVPASRGVVLIGLAGLIVLLAVAGRKRSSGLFVLVLAPALLASPKLANAQQSTPFIFVEISQEDGVPSAEHVVEDFDPSSGLPPPINALSVENPEYLEYLIPREYRAQGDFKAYLETNPDLPRARLEQTIIVRYPAVADLDEALTALLADPYVRHANIPAPLELSTLPGGSTSKQGSGKQAAIPKGTATQYWINAMNFSGAWLRAGGWSMVGVLDNGLDVDHPDMRATNSSNALTGGNFLPHLSADIGRLGIFANSVDYNVDEMEPLPVTSPVQAACDPGGTGFISSIYAGHGTHVHGLIAASHANSDGVVGTCKNCGLASIRTLYEECYSSSGTVGPQLNAAAVWAGIAIFGDTGAQIINMSFGAPWEQNYCANSVNANKTECLSLASAHANGVMMVAASGNSRTKLNFPASDSRVASVGGLDETSDLWNEDKDPPPNHTNNCPFYPSYPDAECGSNYTVNVSTDAKQEHVAPARRVLSTFYPGMPWHPDILCDDAALGVNGDGQGPCTGTSMSTPIISGLVGILRSVNPLVLPGDGVLDAPYRGIRSVLIGSSVLPSASEMWNPKLGYGRTKADMAVAAMLGTSDNAPVKNRVTPLFSFYGAASKDWAYTTVPQAALALMINQAGSYAPQGTLTPGYGVFPYAWPAPIPPAPRASAYVLTTEFKPKTSHPNLVPLYWLDRAKFWPVGCTPGVTGCNGNNRDFLLLTSAAHVQTALNDGYHYRGLQGYVYQSCTPEATCVPEGAERLWLKCKTADDDCAVFLERDRASFEAQGYTAAYPAGSNMRLGYAYPNVDSDGDGLIDGFEYLLGSKQNQADSDMDGIADGVEYPQAGVPVSDPCSSGRCRAGYLFEDGFEAVP